MKAIAISLTLLLLTFCDLYADVAPDPLHKGIHPTRKRSKIELVSERVDVFLGTDRCDFEVSFVLRNRSVVTEKMEVGFPTSHNNDVKDPIIRVNGNRVNTRNELEQEIFTQKVNGEEYARKSKIYWILWDMRVEAGQTKNITMNYYAYISY